MSHLVSENKSIKVVLCLEEIKSKTLGQDPDNLRNFLMKDFNYDCEEAMKLIDEAIVANIIKSAIFNGKIACRIIRADSKADHTIIVPETDEDNSHVAQNHETAVIKDSHIPPNDQPISTILTIIENFRFWLEAVEKRLMKIEDHFIGLGIPTLAINPNSGNTIQDNFYTNSLRNRISKLEKQLADENAIIDFLSAQIISKPQGI